MNPRQVKSASDAAQIVREKGLRHIKLGLVDLDGVVRGKYVSAKKFISALDSGFGFCDVVLGWDVEDQPLDNVGQTGWHKGFPDANAQIVPESCRSIPFEPETLFFLCDFAPPAGAISPRSVLGRCVDRCKGAGFTPMAALEYEFFVFEETPQSVRDKGYANLTPLSPGAFGYSVLRATAGSEFFQAILSTCEEMDVPLEGLHTETGPGVLEAAITVDEALEAADKAAIFKTFIKALAQRHGYMATFMAKWSAQQAGQSGHIHLSLKDDQGRNAFVDSKMPSGISQHMRRFIGGQQALMPELLAMVASNVNSYSRLVPGFWAPTNATWGVENRTRAIRAIPGSDKSQRVEYRVAGADANPYLAMAAALGSGLYGIEHEMEPDEAISGNGYLAELSESRRLPESLWDAAQKLKASAAARAMFGDAFVDHFAASREWEERVFRRHVTDWELARYFEII